MQLDDYFTFLAPDDIRLKGTRVGIETVLYDYIHRSRTPEEIAQAYTTLTIEQVYAALLYYHHNKKAIEAYLSDWLAFGRRMREEQQRNPPPFVEKLRSVKAEREATGTPAR